MRHPFDHIDEKLERAEQHLEDLYRTIETFLDSIPHRMVPDAKLEAVTELERTVSRLEIPARISILAGEAIHQTRSALAAEVKHVVHHAALVSRDHGA